MAFITCLLVREARGQESTHGCCRATGRWVSDPKGALGRASGSAPERCLRYLHHTSDVAARDGGSTVTKLCSEGARLPFGRAKGERWWSCHCTNAERGRTGYVAAAEEEEEEEEEVGISLTSKPNMSHQDPTAASGKRAGVHGQRLACGIAQSQAAAGTRDHLGEEKK